MKHFCLLSAFILLHGCAQISEIYTPSIRALTPDYARPVETSLTPLKPQRALADMTEGEQTIHASNGRYMKTVVRNGLLDDYADVYYPNGKLQSHTPLKEGFAQGWSTGYRNDGSVMSRILYKDGRIIRLQKIDEKGQVVSDVHVAPTQP